MPFVVVYDNGRSLPESAHRLKVLFRTRSLLIGLQSVLVCVLEVYVPQLLDLLLASQLVTDHVLELLLQVLYLSRKKGILLLQLGNLGLRGCQGHLNRFHKLLEVARLSLLVVGGIVYLTHTGQLLSLLSNHAFERQLRQLHLLKLLGTKGRLF